MAVANDAAEVAAVAAVGVVAGEGHFADLVERNTVAVAVAVAEAASAGFALEMAMKARNSNSILAARVYMAAVAKRRELRHGNMKMLAHLNALLWVFEA